jgi:hypothetical protein
MFSPLTATGRTTMYRCFIAAVALATLALPAAAQVQRPFPQDALRGEIAFSAPPEIKLNGKPARLAPGSRIRNANNMLEMSGALVGQRLVVNYTVDTSGLVKDVWLLRPDEAAKKPWPTTAAQAQTWSFDPAAQVWAKP